MKNNLKTFLEAFFLSIIILAFIALVVLILFPSGFEVIFQGFNVVLVMGAIIVAFVIVFVFSWVLFSLIHKMGSFSGKKEASKKEGVVEQKKINYVKLSKKEAEDVMHGQRVPLIEEHVSAKKSEVKEFEKEINASKELGGKISSLKKPGEILPSRVPGFDKLIEKRGFERGSTILISGGAGTGKTTFSFETLYKGALNGEKGIYISLEEDVEKIKKHMKQNFGWDIEQLEKKGLIALLKIDSLEIARKVEALTLKGNEEFDIEIGELELPFVPDRIVIDSLSALALAFGSTDSYRIYIRYLFEMLEKYDSVNLVLGETEQNPKIYSKAGIQEFLADGVIVFYNIQVKNERENALEILKLRSSKHKKKIIPYEITEKGIEVYPDQEVFSD